MRARKKVHNDEVNALNLVQERANEKLRPVKLVFCSVIARNKVPKQSRFFVSIVSIDDDFIWIASSQAPRNDGKVQQTIKTNFTGRNFVVDKQLPKVYNGV